MTVDIAVRTGTPADLDQVMALAQMMHDEIGISKFEPAKVLPDVYAALSLDHGIMGLIGDPGAPLQGGILLRLGNTFYSDEEVIEERGLFVHPDYRSAKGGRAARLCEFAKKTSDDLGKPLLVGVQNDVRTPGKMRLYERQFGKPCGAWFLHRPGESAPSHANEAA